MPLLSVILPVYNEAGTISHILEKINSVDIDKEIIVVDDGSCDATGRILRDIRYNNFKLIHHSSNRGKGAALLTGLANAVGEFVIVQDADLEYDPKDYLLLLEEITKDNIDIALGSRFIKGHQGLFMHRLGNKFLTGLLNLLFNQRLNDYATCYKLARRNTFCSLGLEAKGFDIDVEIIAKALRKKLHIVEVAVSYHPRSYSEGKKIRWLDGLWAIFCIFKYRFKPLD